MMGRSHVLSGLIIGTAVAGALTAAPVPVRLLAIPVAGGAALLCDIDHPSSKVARTLGPVTRALAVAVQSVSLAVYHSTVTDQDSPDRASGHRLVTHTVPGCAVFGALVAAVCAVHPGAGAAVLAVLVALMGSGVRARGAGLLVAGAAGSWLVVHAYPGWWWLWGAVTFAGALSHVLGDMWTHSGVPVCWPLVVHGRRWYRVTAPATFSTGTTVETTVVTPLLYGALVLCGGWATGVLPVVAGLVWSVAGG